MDLFKLLGTIVIDNAGANKALDETSNKAKDTAEDIGGVGDSGNKTSGKFATAMGKIGSVAVKVGKTVAVGIAAAGTAIGGVTVKALSAAGELEQNMGGSEAVFGDYAAKMQDTAKTAFSNMGLSTSDYLATANKMGALFQGAGFSIEESMNLSSSAMQRAADVASIMGIDTSAAMEAIAGAAKGNFTMMDNLGVAMNDTTLQAYALEKGIKKSTSEMTNQEKIGLAMEMFLDKTAYATGNYAKENETLAGSLGTAKSALTNFLDGSGSVEALVSSFGNLATVAVKSLDEILPRLTTGLTEIVNQIMPMMPPLLNTLLPSIIQGATGLINGLVSAFPGIISVLMGVLPALIQGVQTIINALITALPQIMESLVSALPTLIPLLVNGLVSMIITLCTMLPQIIQPIIDYMPEIIVSIVNALMENLPALIMGVAQLVMGLVAALPQILQVVWEVIVSVFTNLPQWFGSIFDSIVNVIASIFPGAKDQIMVVWEAIKNYISTVVNSIQNVITTVWDSIKNAISTVIDSIKNVISTAWEAIKTIIANVMNIIFSVISGDWESVRGSISNILNAIRSVISSVWNGIKSVISSVLNGINSVVSSVFNGLKSVATSAFNGIKSVASSVWNGIKTAMTNPIQTAKDKIKGMIDSIVGFFSGAKLEFPNIKLPHFSITGSFSLAPPSVPKLSVDWYAKAMNNPMIMNDPTIFGYNPATGSFMGGGEAGSEIVSGTNTLMNMIGQAVESKSAEQNERIISLLIALLNAITGGNEELIRAVMADRTFAVGEREFGRLVKQYAR